MSGFLRYLLSDVSCQMCRTMRMKMKRALNKGNRPTMKQAEKKQTIRKYNARHSQSKDKTEFVTSIYVFAIHYNVKVYVPDAGP